MITMTISVKVRTHKLKEFLQTLDSLMAKFRQKEGNLSYQYQQDSNDNDVIQIRAEWRNWENLESHFQSNLFSVLLGAIRVLCEEPEVKIDEGFGVMGIETIDKVRKKEQPKN